MTTVVASAELGVMAADHRCTGGGPMAHVQKIHRIKGTLVGFAGDSMLALHIVEWLKGKREVPELYKLIPEVHRDSVDVLELSSKGLALWTGWGTRLPLLDNSYAIGSGSMAALAALRLGAPPAQAITLAASLDECSGAYPAPYVEHLKPERKPRA